MQEYISHLLGHEGRGSVLAQLKCAGLATELCAGCDDEDLTSACSQFRVNIELTRAGAHAIDAVVIAVFEYLGMLGASPAREYVYEEMRDVAAMRFRYAEGEGSLDCVRRLSLSMQAPRCTPEMCPRVIYSREMYAREIRPRSRRELGPSVCRAATTPTRRYAPTRSTRRLIPD